MQGVGSHAFATHSGQAYIHIALLREKLHTLSQLPMWSRYFPKYSDLTIPKANLLRASDVFRCQENLRRKQGIEARCMTATLPFTHPKPPLPSDLIASFYSKDLLTLIIFCDQYRGVELLIKIPRKSPTKHIIEA
jgi:hypothetical protein